jgi:hypothetical protein
MGFCKKVQSDEVQSVDVWIDGEKVETLKCDKTIDKISKVYNKAGFAFQHSLPDQYIGEKHLVGFTCSGQDLENSPICAIEKNDANFGEFKFRHSFTFLIDENKLKDLYCKNVIGFLAVEENLSDTKFIQYLDELLTYMDYVKIKLLCLDENAKNEVEKIFTHKSFEVVVVENIYDIASHLEVFYIPNYINPINTLVSETIIKYSNKIYVTDFSASYKNDLISSERDTDKYREHIIVKNYESFGYTKEDIHASYNIDLLTLKKNLSIIELDIGNLNQITKYEMYYFLTIRFILSSNDVKNRMINVHRMVRKLA